jgi:hypothetical protein
VRVQARSRVMQMCIYVRRGMSTASSAEEAKANSSSTVFRVGDGCAVRMGVVDRCSIFVMWAVLRCFTMVSAVTQHRVKRCLIIRSESISTHTVPNAPQCSVSAASAHCLPLFSAFSSAILRTFLRPTPRNETKHSLRSNAPHSLLSPPAS